MSKVLPPPFVSDDSTDPDLDPEGLLNRLSSLPPGEQIRRLSQMLAQASGRDPSLPQGGMTREQIIDMLSQAGDLSTVSPAIGRFESRPPQARMPFTPVPGGAPVIYPAPGAATTTEFVPDPFTATWGAGKLLKGTGSAIERIQRAFPATPEAPVDLARRQALMKIFRPISEPAAPAAAMGAREEAVEAGTGLNAPIDRRAAIKIGVGGVTAATQADNLIGLLKSAPPMSPAPVIPPVPIVPPMPNVQISDIIEILGKEIGPAGHDVTKVIASVPRPKYINKLPEGYTFKVIPVNFKSGFPSGTGHVKGAILNKSGKEVFNSGVYRRDSLPEDFKDNTIEYYLGEKNTNAVQYATNKARNGIAPEGKVPYSKYPGYLYGREDEVVGSVYSEPIKQLTKYINDLRPQYYRMVDKFEEALNNVKKDANTAGVYLDYPRYYTRYDRKFNYANWLDNYRDVIPKLREAGISQNEINYFSDIVRNLPSAEYQLHILRNNAASAVTEFGTPNFIVRYHPDSAPDVRKHPLWKDVLSHYPRSASINRARVIGEFTTRDAANREMAAWLEANFGITGATPGKGQKIKLPNGDTISVRQEIKELYTSASRYRKNLPKKQE